MAQENVRQYPLNSHTWKKHEKTVEASRTCLAHRHPMQQEHQIAGCDRRTFGAELLGRQRGAVTKHMDFGLSQPCLWATEKKIFVAK